MNTHQIKILMITTDHLMIDRRILQEAKSLISQGYKVTLLAGFECSKRESYTYDGIQIERFVYDWNDSRFSSLVKRCKLKPSSLIYKLTGYLFRFWAKYLAQINSFEQFALERLLEHQADVLHVHDYPMLASGAKFAKIRNVPLVYDAHELYYAQVQLPKRVQDKYRHREAKLITNASEIITVNPYIAKLMANRYKIPVPNVIYNASPLQPIRSCNFLHKRFQLNPTTQIVLYQGWISDNRGINQIVEAASYFIPNVVLVIVGYGEYEVILKEIVGKLNLHERVFFYGGVSSHELHLLTCDASLGIIPYYGIDENNYYCSPNKLFEFTVAGLPFVSNDLPFLRDIALEYGHGFLADLSSSLKIADAINKIFTDEKLLKKLQMAALEARTKMNWEVEERKLFKIYDGLFNGSDNKNPLVFENINQIKTMQIRGSV